MMSLKIISADERLRAPSAIKGVVLGPSGIGKTSLLRTLNPSNTLAVDLEAGMLAVQDWPGDSLQLRDWETARNVACWIGGANPARRENQPYSKAHFDYVCGQYGDPAQSLAKYETIFVDSITVASRLALQWAKGQPEALSEKTGKPDLRGAYGLLGQEVVAWLTQLQHTQRNIWLVGILDKVTDDYGRTSWAPQMEGSKAKNEMIGIFDQVISMVELKTEDGQPYRGFVTKTLNEFGYPAKDRSGRLDPIEEPHLHRLMTKITASPRADGSMSFGAPAPVAPPELPPAQIAFPPQPGWTPPQDDDEVPF
jgi:hypothetical protein